jgi:hypothetical protein
MHNSKIAFMRGKIIEGSKAVDMEIMGRIWDEGSA